MLVLKCAKCRRKLYKYLKVGKGRLLHCWKGRIDEDNTKKHGDIVKCPCGNVIGIDKGKFIKLKQRSFTRTGNIVKKLK
jgi:hypothetical protein